MELIADVLLISAALGAAMYCHVLQRKLRALTKLEGGLGGAIAVLSVQVDEMRRSLEAAQQVAQGSGSHLEGVVVRAEQVGQRLELLVSALHDLPQNGPSLESEPLRGRGLRARARRYAEEAT